MKLKLGPEDPLVKEALSGIHKSSCGRLFFKINDLTGEHRKVSVARELAPLDITHDNRKSLVRSFLFEELPYASERMKAMAAAAAAKSKEPRAKLVMEDGDSYDDFTDDELPEEETVAETKAVKAGKNCHYYLVQQDHKYWGVYNSIDGGQVLFTDRQQAEEYLEDLLHHGESKMFYGSRN
jgi:hypothetical protein